MITTLIIKLLEVDANTIGTLVGSVGFPVALCIGLLYYLFKVQRDHKEETDQLKDAINNLNVVMKQILEHIRKLDSDNSKEDE